MYMEDTTMYMDILPFDINAPQKTEHFKQILPELNDPWLVDQAGLSDIHFPDFGTSTTDLLEGRLSPSMEKIANSLLPSDMSLPLNDTFDMNVVFDSETQNNDILGAALEGLELEPSSTHHPQIVTQRRRSKRLASKSTNLTTHLDSYTPEVPQLYKVEDVFSPGSGNNGDEIRDGDKETRKRRPKIPYSTLTEDEKYQRIRYLNNEASKLYRERMRDHLTSLQKKERKELERNALLRTKAEKLEKLRNEIQAYTFNFIKEHMGNSGVQ